MIPIVIILSCVLYVLSCLSTIDKRLLQAKRQGQDVEQLPKGVAIIYYIYYPLFVVLFILNWKLGLILLVSFFILAVLPVSETIGNLLFGTILKPFVKKKDKS